MEKGKKKKERRTMIIFEDAGGLQSIKHIFVYSFSSNSYKNATQLSLSLRLVGVLHINPFFSPFYSVYDQISTKYSESFFIA